MNRRSRLRELNEQLHKARSVHHKATAEMENCEREFSDKLQELKVKPDPECCCAMRTTAYHPDYGNFWYCTSCFCIIDPSKDVD